MTIFEMLDLLDSEIVVLRARNQELKMALERRERIEAPRVSSNRKKSPAKKKRGRKTVKKESVKKGEQLSLPALAEEAKPEQDARPVGKRLALGKSLVQLRRASASRPL